MNAPWLLIPADHPVVEAAVITILLDAAARNPGAIIVPTYAGRRGHPTVFAWKHALAERTIPADEGFNWIVKRHEAEVVEIAVDTASVLLDLDTPADYERLRREWKSAE